MATRRISDAQLLLALGAFVVAFLLWQSNVLSPLVYPLRLFVTFIHELGHGVAAISTGGEFVRFEVKSTGAGLAYSRGGIRPVIIAAGYLGTALFGATLLYFANHVRKPQWIAIGLGLGFSLLTILYTGLHIVYVDTVELIPIVILLLAGGWLFLTRQTNQGRWVGVGTAALGVLGTLYFSAGDNTLSLLVGVISGVVLVLIGYQGLASGRPALSQFILNFLAIAVGLNAITDTWFLFKIVSNPDLLVHNDASSMAREFILPAEFWALVWIGTSIALFGGSVWLTFVRPLRQGNHKQGQGEEHRLAEEDDAHPLPG